MVPSSFFGAAGLIDNDHRFAAVSRGGHLVVGLGVRDREAQATNGALVVHRDLCDLFGIGFLRTRRGQ